MSTVYGLSTSNAFTGACGVLDLSSTGTAIIKFKAPTGTDTRVVNGVTKDICTMHQCITSMKEYKNKSLEELRMEDYSVSRKGRGATTPFTSTNVTPDFNSRSTALAKDLFVFKGKPMGGRGVLDSSSTGTAIIKFKAPTGTDTRVVNGVTKEICTMHQCITSMKEYENKSLEELRMEDYAVNRKGGGDTNRFNLANITPVFPTRFTTQSNTPFVFNGTLSGVRDASTSTHSGTFIKFKAGTGQDTMMKEGAPIFVTTRHQCITSMREYDNKSLEELRLEDYAANRKGVVDVFKETVKKGSEVNSKAQSGKDNSVDKKCLKNMNPKDQFENLKENFRNLLEDELICNICTEILIKPVTLGCSHTFCKYCIIEWKEKRNQCPLCRAWIVTEISSLSLENFINKAVKQLDPENQEKRMEIIRCREELLKK